VKSVATRLRDDNEIEQRLLDLAHTTDAKLTPAALAYFAPCSLDDAVRVLEGLAARDRLRMEVQEDGTIVYELPGRQPLAPTRPLQPAVIREVRPVRFASPVVAGFLSAIVPGAGQLYAGRVIAAFLWFFAVGAGYVLLFPGLVLHLFCIASAVSSAHAHNDGGGPHLLAPGRV
jgi:hypothetical protein